MSAAAPGWRPRLLALVLACSATMAQAGSPHAQAVQDARAGRYDSALATLQQLVQQAPRRLDYRYDLIAVLSWAERHAEALQASRSLALGAAVPDYVLAAIGKSALDQQAHQRAEQAYGLLARRRPASADAALGAGLALLDAGKPARADAQLRRALRLARRDTAMLQAALEALQARGDRARARPFGERLLALGAAPSAPAPAAAQPAAVPGPAAAPASAPAPTLAQAQEHNALQIRQASERLDRDFTPARYGPIDAALADNAALIERAQAAGEAEVLLRLRRDRVVALRQRGHMDEALALFQALEQQAPQPAYVVLAAADAELQRRQPQRARALYRRVLGEQPGDGAARSGLVFAQIEAEDFAAAEALGAQLLADSGHSLAARRTQNMLLRFADRLDEAEAGLHALQAEQPDDAGLWLEQAELLARRGLPRAAAERFEAVLRRAPDSIRARVGLAEALWAQGDLAATRQALQALQAEAPEHPAVQALQRAWQRNGRPLLVSGATRGMGRGRIAGNDDLVWDSSLYSGMFADGWRLLASHHLAFASFDGLRARHERVGMGAELTRRDWQASAEIGRDLTNGHDVGWAVGGSLQLDDHWSLRARHESRTNDFPLKGRRPDAQRYLGSPRHLHASKTVLGTAWRWNESRRVAADLSYYHFNDGNRRKALSASWTERLYSGYGSTLDLQPALYASASTLRNAVYFNPARDLALSLTLAGDWLTWRRYERSFHQRLAVTLGGYRQHSDVQTGSDQWRDKVYGWELFHDLRYEHAWNIGPDFSTRYGIGTRRFPYDGRYENKTYVFLHASWRF